MKVFWTKFALASLKDIYTYYNKNVSTIIARKIRDNIFQCTWQLEKHPLTGAIEEHLEDLQEGHRFILRGNYKIIYKIQQKKIFVTDIFDTRQNPEKIKQRNK